MRPWDRAFIQHLAMEAGLTEDLADRMVNMGSSHLRPILRSIAETYVAARDQAEAAGVLDAFFEDFDRSDPRAFEDVVYNLGLDEQWKAFVEAEGWNYFTADLGSYASPDRIAADVLVLIAETLTKGMWSADRAELRAVTS